MSQQKSQNNNSELSTEEEQKAERMSKELQNLAEEYGSLQTLKEKCPEIKQEYEKCFEQWYKNSFNKHKDLEKPTLQLGCEHLWKAYKFCATMAVELNKNEE
eukprot:gb/GECH01013390.1/.p1 GENE.gb/GECH01013390.1/~~gb/GECH01013390.1/.p1  ORF type:complete len:102 (+),score=36.73 gb/GECH01013390.1/:1-306(+)